MITEGTKWVKERGRGNYMWSWKLVVEYKGEEVKMCEITQFKKGEYVLPSSWFPRKENGMPQKSRAIHQAKYDCEKWLADFLKHMTR